MLASYKKTRWCALVVSCLICLRVVITSEVKTQITPEPENASEPENAPETGSAKQEITATGSVNVLKTPNQPDVTNATNDSELVGFCREPTLPLRVIEALESKYENNTQIQSGFQPTRKGGLWYKKHTKIFVGCHTGYTPIYNGPLTSTCLQSDESKYPEWKGTFPQCEVTACWWLGDLTGVEFRFNGQLLHRIENGFPEGTELKYLNWTCPTGYFANATSRYCHFGHWNGSEPICIEIPSTTITTPTTLTTVTLQTVTQSPNASDNLTGPVKDEPTSVNAMLIWAVLMTTVCIALVISLVLIIRYGKCFKKQTRENQERYSYEHRPLNQAENIYGEIHSSTREDLGYMSIDQSTYELNNRRSNTYEDIETTEVSTLSVSRPIIYAVPVPKPRRTAPSTESIANDQQGVLQVSHDVPR